MVIDPEKPIPKYLQLKDIITQYFQKAQLKAGEKIPTETELMEQFQVSRSTVRQTLAELVNEGVIYRRQGSGTFFAGDDPAGQAQSHLIGVLTPRISYYIYPKLIQGIDEVARQQRYNIVLTNADANPDQELAMLEQLLEKDIEGLLLEPTGGFKDLHESKLFQVVQNLRIPVVLMNWAIDEFDISYVSLNDVEGGFKATKYLLDAGHRRIAYLYPDDKIPALQRYQGYRNALEVAGVPYDRRFDKPTIGVLWDDLEHMKRLIQELLVLGDDRPTAIFFFNDDAALHAYTTIREAGLRIPEDISIIGYDDFEFAARMDVPLTTIIHPNYQIGKWAAEILFDEIKQRGQNPTRHLILRPTLAERASVKILQPDGEPSFS